MFYKIISQVGKIGALQQQVSKINLSAKFFLSEGVNASTILAVPFFLFFSAVSNVHFSTIKSFFSNFGHAQVEIR